MLVDVIERIYNGSMIKFVKESIITGWCKSDSGVRQGCLSLIFIIVQHICDKIRYENISM